ncbi:MAG: AraC family transcriptional regulator [Candidatus Eisenbacteria bacterium]|uniref:AraC family transcriptional regulator n=1 Tax=Eiseniibacteriota bacterium TaxID=2212470 RepID=A0A956LY18_UNCEI|nr:AraC family transcriptional regulator [Candidatus Eisenbacteria bacterium]
MQPNGIATMTVSFHKFPPSGELSPFVRFYYSVDSPSPRPETVSNHPLGGVDLVFSLRGATCFRTEGHTSVMDGVFLLPLQERPFETTFDPDLHHFGIAFRAEGFTRLFDFPIGGLANCGVVIGSELSELETLRGALFRQESGQDRARIVDQYLGDRLHTVPERNPAALEVVRQIRGRGGNVSLDELCREVRASARTVQRWSRDLLGVSPKTYSQIVRFNTFLHRLRRDPVRPPLDIALSLGYYDQSHLTAEVRRFTGHPPGRFFRRPDGVSEFFGGNRTSLAVDSEDR